MPLPDRTPQVGSTCSGSAQGMGMGPADILAAYNVPSSSAGNGKIVALVDMADSTAFSDVTGYRAAEGLPALPQCTSVPGGVGTPPCFAQVDSETGAVTTPTTSVSTDADGETGLDMAMVSAACPDCSILLVGISSASSNLAGDNGWQAFVDAVATAKQLKASAVSISFSGPENTDPNAIMAGAATGTPDFTGGYTGAGVPVFAAAGDFAYLDQNLGVDQNNTIAGDSPGYPASAPDVIAVGGTMLFNTGSKYDEAVWDDGTFGQLGQGQDQDVTTSGCSTEFAMPTWQASALSGTNCAKRATSDLSAAAAFTSGGQDLGIVICASGQLGGGNEGTSASTPMVAALFTRIGITTTISNNLGWIYENPTGFHDLGSAAYPVDPAGSSTDAANPSTCGKLCSAATGWDGPSGMGTPDTTVLATLGGTSSSSGSGSGSSSGGSSSSGSSSGGGASSDGGQSSSGSGSSGGSSSSGSSSGGQSSSGTGSSSGARPDAGIPSTEDSGAGAEDAGGGTNGFSGGSGSGCSVSANRDDGTPSGLGLAALGLAVIGRRRRNRRSDA
jgi:MYXO-CTERM domain-containing protein